MLKIGDFSKLSRISIRMLRHYDEIGLLVPKNIDSFSGYRFYEAAQLPVADRIHSFKSMGFSLSAIAEIFMNYDNPQKLEDFLKAKQAEITAEAEEISQRLLLLETALIRLRKDNKAMNYNVTIKTIPERYVASVRKTIPSYDKEGMLWKILMKETASLGMQIEGSGLVIYHDDGYKESEVDVEAQISVKGLYKNTENVVFKTEPKIEIASASYKGSYDQLTAVNHAVAAWIQDNGYEFNNKMFCIYHISPNDTDNQDEYVTEVCFAVKKR